MTTRYYGQTDQDLMLDRALFRGLERGTFFDIGANDGVTYSNTLMFEQSRHWNGICVEADPLVFPALQKNRKCICVNAGVAPAAGTMPFLQIEGPAQMLSGFLANFDSRRMERVDYSIARSGGTKRVVDVEAVTPAELLKRHNLAEIHYLNIDTEGNELDILRAFDFNAVFVHAITVECNYDDELTKLLEVTKEHFDFVVRHIDDVFLVNRKSPFFANAAGLRRASAQRKLVRRLKRFVTNTPKKIARFARKLTGSAGK
jgi:FkbM family methyltransferase